MSKGFFEYAEQHGNGAIPQAEQEEFTLLANTRDADNKRVATAMDLQETVMQELQNGTEPHLILAAAIKCIGMLTNNTEWQETALVQLDKVYKDLEQQSLFADNRAIEGKRLKELTVKHNELLRRSIETRLRKLDKLQTDLEKALNDLSELEAIDE